MFVNPPPPPPKKKFKNFKKLTPLRQNSKCLKKTWN